MSTRPKVRRGGDSGAFICRHRGCPKRGKRSEFHHHCGHCGKPIAPRLKYCDPAHRKLYNAGVNRHRKERVECHIVFPGSRKVYRTWVPRRALGWLKHPVGEVKKGWLQHSAGEGGK